MTPEALMNTLRPAQEQRGFYFNPDRQLTLALLAGVLRNRQRYGYGSCPGRLALRDRERDRDIICPCAFREEDVKLYDRCHCHLYVSEAVVQGRTTAAERVPERWARV